MVDVAAIRGQVEHLLRSELFRGSATQGRLLSYLAEKSLLGEAENLKEYTIGVDIFGKPQDYDPRSDASVRFQAGKLRQKLKEHYSSGGLDDPVHIGLPKGHFQLVFSSNANANGARRVVWRLTAWRIATFTLAATLAVALILLGRSRMELSESRRLTDYWRALWTPELEEIWKPFLKSSRPTVVSLGTPLFAQFGPVFVRDTRIREWSDLTKSEAVEAVRERLHQDVSGPSFPFTGIGEAHGAVLLAKLWMGKRDDFLFKGSQSVAWEDVLACNVIFLGSPKFNSQLHDLPNELDFVVAPRMIRNLRPRAGEAVEYPTRPESPGNSTCEDYATISLLPGPATQGVIMVLASSSNEGTWAAAEYLTRPEHAREMVARLRTSSGGLPASYQVLIRARFNAKVPVQVAYVTHHELRPAGANRVQ